MASPAEGFTQLLAILDQMEVAYSVGGSVASSTHGIPRTTMDVDIVADLREEQVEQLVELAGGDFYALHRGRSFNLIHLDSSYKFDIFPLRADPYSHTEFSRRSFTPFRTFGDPIECAAATAEDTILRKLEWYRAGGETSERQWNDLRGIRMVSGAILDHQYLREWAKYLKVDDLLERLLAEKLPSAC